MDERAQNKKRIGAVGAVGAGSAASGISKVRSSRKVPASSSKVDRTERSSRTSSRSSRNRSKRSSQSPAKSYLAEAKIACLSNIPEEVNKSKQSSPSPATNHPLETTTECLSTLTEEVNETPAKSDTSCGHKCFNKATCKHACCIPTPAPVINGTISDALVSPLQKPTKPAPTYHDSCKHKCGDKATCRHLCCNITLRLIDLSRASDFVKNDDMIACMVKFLPMEDLFLRVRQVSRMFKQTIESSETYRKAAFLQAEPSKDPSFRASIKDALLDPQTLDGDTVQDRFLRGPWMRRPIDAPYRSVRVNPFLFTILASTSLTDAVAAARRHNMALPDPRYYSKDGVMLCPEMLLRFSAANNSRLNDRSSCMEMFLTQPPVKEMVFDALEYAVVAGHYDDPNHGVPQQFFLATDGEGLRYRDLYQHLNRFMRWEGVLYIINQASAFIPSCEALNHHGLPVLKKSLQR
ncbi:unnamed protein product [Zymoseptoria tritici ST99CH_1E4]|uniref:F-box domain-containing protein n=1 Tax=Zymoseptoria tritici ST99CH_1E4 TaxID=1276532 RepID=A0A2H1GPT1_ZYMTR|nr:unnamed protein product [Zymoseptoria tritici ST99CH_1E4]